jgi:hypothetical protein
MVLLVSKVKKSVSDQEQSQEESKLAWRIGQLLDSPTGRRTELPGGLHLVWKPGPAGDWQELVACRRDNYPGPVEDEIVMACLKTAVKKRNQVAAYLSMTPQVKRAGWGATVYKFKLARQARLL